MHARESRTRVTQHTCSSVPRPSLRLDTRPTETAIETDTPPTQTQTAIETDTPPTQTQTAIETAPPAHAAPPSLAHSPSAPFSLSATAPLYPAGRWG
eukprot:2523362-Rhodomonas_salina.1